MMIEEERGRGKRKRKSTEVVSQSHQGRERKEGRTSY